MQLKVQTHNVSETDHVLRNVFERYHLASEIREIDREDEEDPMGRIVYHLTISPRMSTDQLSEEIFSADPKQIAYDGSDCADRAIVQDGQIAR